MKKSRQDNQKKKIAAMLKMNGSKLIHEIINLL